MHYSRRTFIKEMGLGSGAIVLSPIVQRLHAEAAGKQLQTKRFVFVLQSNGFQPWAAQPKGLERTRGGPDHVTEIPLADCDLSDDLGPLAPHKKRVSIIQRLNGTHCNPYHGGGFAALSGGSEKRQPRAETIDAALAKAYPGVFPIVNLGLPYRQDRWIGIRSEYICSAWGPGKPIATQCRPDLAYQSLFGSVAEGELREGFDARKRLLDFMNDDVRRVRTRLGVKEREKFDYYVNSFESMSERLTKILGMRKQLAKYAPEVDEGYSTPNETERLDAQFELAAASLIAGLTNVVTICSGLCGPNGSLPGLGIDIPIHKIGHGGTDKGRNADELYTIIRRHHMALIAGLIDKLEAAPEGDGSMMDNTLIVYTSDGADAHHTDGKEWPFVLIGDLGGRLKTGRFIEYPGYGNPGNRTINALYCTLLHAAGAPRDHFNLAGGLENLDEPGPIPELLV